MTWTTATALAAGAAVGFAYFGGLWRDVRAGAGRRRPGRRLALHRAVRLTAAAVAFSVAARTGPFATAAMLLGFLGARTCLVWRLAAGGCDARS